MLLPGVVVRRHSKRLMVSNRAACAERSNKQSHFKHFENNTCRPHKESELPHTVFPVRIYRDHGQCTSGKSVMCTAGYDKDDSVTRFKTNIKLKSQHTGIHNALHQPTATFSPHPSPSNPPNTTPLHSTSPHSTPVPHPGHPPKLATTSTLPQAQPGSARHSQPPQPPTPTPPNDFSTYH